MQKKEHFLRLLYRLICRSVKNKLEFAVAEAPNGEDLIYAVYYDGEELDNNGGDTTGKGYYTYLWKQEF